MNSMLASLTAIVLGAISSQGFTQELPPEFRTHLSFEYGDDGGNLPGWGGGPRDTIVRDNEIEQGGTSSARLQRTTGSTQEFSTLTYRIDQRYEGETIRLAGKLRTNEVVGYTGLWMRLDGATGPLEFDNMMDSGVDGTRDWQDYSIELPLHPDARKIVFGVLLVGEGTVWADDLVLSIDGVSIDEADSVPLKLTALDRETEFDDGSRIEFDALNDQQIANLVLLGKVWGFLKYHHPAVAGGEYHWDYELLRIMPAVLAAESPPDAQEVLADWITGLGKIDDCTTCAKSPQRTHLVPRLDWLDDETLLGRQLRALLTRAYENRPSADSSFFVETSGGAGNAVFRNEPYYSQFKFELPDAGFRTLAVFRFWNMVEYWFPYRNLIEKPWDDVLADSLRRMAGVDSETAYHRELMLLIGDVHDTHASWQNLMDSVPPTGNCELPQALSFVEGKLTVVRPALDDSLLATGDIIESIAGRSIDVLVNEVAKYYPASNEAVRRRNIAWKIDHGDCGATSIDVLRGEQRLQLESTRVASEDVDRSLRWSADRAGTAFQMLSGDVAYLKLSAISKEDISSYLERAAGTRGMVIDIRGYPAEFVVFALGQHLVDIPTPFATFTRPDVSNPGAFVWTDAVSLTPQEPYYGGRLALLVNEFTQSQAEYTAMAFRAARDSVVVGGTTAGADGNFSSIAMPGAIYGGISGLGVFYADQRQTQRIGILPDKTVNPTIAGIRAGRDEVLEAGIATILGDGADPAEIRRMARRP